MLASVIRVQPQYHVKLCSDLPVEFKSYRVWSQYPESGNEACLNQTEPFIRNAGLNRQYTKDGIGIQGDGNVQYFWRDALVVPQAAWIACSFITKTITGTRQVYGIGSSAVSSGALLAILSSNSNSKITSIFRTTDGESSISIVGPTIVTATTYNVVAVFPTDQYVDAYIYINGIKYNTSTAINGNFASPSNLVYECALATKRGAVANMADDIILWSAYGIGLIPELFARQLSENPYSIVQTRRRELISVPVSGGSDLSGSAQSATVAQGSVTSVIPVSGASVAATTVQGTVTNAIPISGASAAITVANGTVSVEMRLTGEAVAAVLSTGSLASGSDLSGAAVGGASGSGELGLALTLSGAAIAQALGAAGVLINQPVSGSSQATGVAAGDLTSLSSGALEGSAGGQSQATGQLLINVPVSGGATAHASGSGNISTIIPVSGATASIVNAVGDLTINLAFDLAGDALSQTVAAGNIKLNTALSGAALGQAIASAALITSVLQSGNLIAKYTITPAARNYTVPAAQRNYTALAAQRNYILKAVIT